VVGVQADVPLRSFLCSLDFAMPADRSLVYAGEVAPYLLGFTGSPAERLVENLKVRPFFVAAKAFLPLTLPPQILRTCQPTKKQSRTRRIRDLHNCVIPSSSVCWARIDTMTPSSPLPGFARSLAESTSSPFPSRSSFATTTVRLTRYTS
jgi:hypothetical protein